MVNMLNIKCQQKFQVIKVHSLQGLFKAMIGRNNQGNKLKQIDRISNTFQIYIACKHSITFQINVFSILFKTS